MGFKASKMLEKLFFDMQMQNKSPYLTCNTQYMYIKGLRSTHLFKL